MASYQISLNQLAEFQGATENVKRRIIAQQLSPDQFRIPWYQLTRARVKKSIELKGNLDPILDGIKTLLNKVPVGKKQESDRHVSLEALERYVKIKLPSLLKDIDFTIIRPKVKSTSISNVEVIVAPDVIVKGVLNGKNILGGVKIHISKTKPFDFQKSQIVASTIYTFLKNEVAEDSIEVLPELCLCLDIFSGRVVSANNHDAKVFKEVREICEEVKRLWDTA
jgi:hypothetical protein